MTLLMLREQGRKNIFDRKALRMYINININYILFNKKKLIYK